MNRYLNAMLVVLAVHTTSHADTLVRNAGNTTTQASKNEVKELYTGKEKSWKGGAALELFLNVADSPELSWLADQIGIPKDMLFMKIKQEVFKGRMKDPARVSSSSECLEHVKKSVGGVCVVDDATAKALPPGVVPLKMQ